VTAPPVAHIRRRVSMTDVDLVQINFARYFPWMDEGFGLLLEECGHPLSSIIANGHATPVVSVQCDYVRPVTLDDRVDGWSAVTKIGTSSFEVSHRFESDGLIAIGRATHVWIAVAPTQRAVPVPQWIHDALDPGFLDDAKAVLR